MFLHGYLSCKESFAWQIESLSRAYAVTAFDFWGMGQSPPLREPWSVGEYADATRGLLDSLGVRGACLIAHSFGGRVALKLLSSPQNPFRAAILTGCAGIPPRRGLSYRMRVRSYRVVRRFAPRFAERRFGSEEYRMLSPVMRESFKKIVNEDLTPCLAAVRVPVLYVFGDRDKETPPYMAEILHAHTAGSGLVYMKGCTHFCFCEQPQQFNAIARAFFG